MQSDEQLMEHYLSGDARAFAQLHARHEPLVRRVVARNVFRAADVDDLVQQTFMQLHASRASYRCGERLKPWLCAMARNVCRDYGRRKKRRPEVAFEMDHLSAEMPSRLPGELEHACAPLTAALASLSAATQRIFHEHFMEDRPLVEIARDLRTNPTTVRVRMHRGCRQLRAALAV
jgi:RNA polymerase sigma factor (sigma-70 family)